jgi:hypothetical protein
LLLELEPLEKWVGTVGKIHNVIENLQVGALPEHARYIEKCAQHAQSIATTIQETPNQDWYKEAMKKKQASS